MTKNSQLLIIVFISTVQLALTLLSVAWLFGWIHDKTEDIAQKQVSEVNLFISGQIADRVKEMKLDDVSLGTEDWRKLQRYVASTDLPDHGFVSVIDADTGKILCHPNANQDLKLLDKTWDEFRVNPSDPSLTSEFAEKRIQKGSHVVFTINNMLYIVHGIRIPELDAIVLTHQRISGVHAINSILISSLKNFSFTVALIIGLMGTVLNVFMVKRIVDEDERIQTQLEQKVEERTDQLRQTKNAIIFGLAKLAESRDNDTGEHLDRIRKYVTIMAKDLAHVYEEIDEEFIDNLGIASSLHDIGKVGIPDSILLKPGRLTSLERSIMEKHTIIGGECLEAISSKLGDNDFLEIAREVAYWHHEQWDGNGYPHQLTDDEIPISARIVAVCDVYDALTSRRPYKRGMTHSESRAIILSGAGQKFDPEVIAAFLRHEAEFQQIARRYQNIDFDSNEQDAPVPVLDGNPPANLFASANESNSTS